MCPSDYNWIGLHSVLLQANLKKIQFPKITEKINKAVLKKTLSTLQRYTLEARKSIIIH